MSEPAVTGDSPIGCGAVSPGWLFPRRRVRFSGAFSISYGVVAAVRAFAAVPSVLASIVMLESYQEGGAVACLAGFLLAFVPSRLESRGPERFACKSRMLRES